MPIGIKSELADRIGSSHVAGLYNFTDGDFLNEGADVLLEMGSRVIKLWFTGRTETDYMFNSDWPQVSSLAELAQTPYYKSVFAKPFTTYMLEAFPAAFAHKSFSGKIEKAEAEVHYREFYDVAVHFLTHYKGTGKTFILQNWEMDWLLTNPEQTKEPEEWEVRRQIDLLDIRQNAVDAARRDVGMDGVVVAHAAEVNLVLRAMEGKVSATNDILPHTHCDLYTYSSYDTSVFYPDRVREALDYLASKAPASELYGEKNVFVGEFGAPENEFDQLELVRNTTEIALDWGAHYVVYWQVYCNEKGKDFDGTATNDNCRGFWLIRPDGTKSPAYDYFAGLLKK